MFLLRHIRLTRCAGEVKRYENCFRKPSPPIFANININGKISQGGIKWVNGYQYFSVGVILYKRLIQQYWPRYVRRHIAEKQ